MMKYNESLQKAGVLLALDGPIRPRWWHASRSREGKPKVTDGPLRRRRRSWRLLDDSGEVEGRGDRMASR